MLRGFRYRFYPTPAREVELIRAAEAAEALEQRSLRAGFEESYATERAAWDFLPEE